MSTNKRRNGWDCSAIGCSMRKGTDQSQIKMFNFPADPIQRAAWINALKRENWYATDNSLICNSHFVTGKPSTDPQHPDYVPSIFCSSKITAEEEQKLQHFERSSKHLKRDMEDEASLTVSTENIESTPDVDPSQSTSKRQDVAVQTDMCLDDIEVMENEIHILKEQITSLRKNTNFTRMFDLVANDQKKFKFYTGLENIGVFDCILKFILSFWQPDTLQVSLEPREQLLLFLMKLRLGLQNQDLACRFQIGKGAVSTVFDSWLSIMFVNFKRLIIWPSRKKVKKHIPQCFKDVSLENVRCIIDCTEILIQKPYNFEAQCQTYSHYKHDYTLKFLIGITPSGAICFLSTAWGGMVSDRLLTRESGFLELLEKDDIILADRAFNINDLLAEKGATLFIPPSTENEDELSADEDELSADEDELSADEDELSADEDQQSQNMSKVRVRVEQAIRRIKKFKILDSIVPISLLENTQGDQFSTMDKILTVICALCNLGVSMIKE